MKRFLSIILCVAMLFSVMSITTSADAASARDVSYEESCAVKLKSLGLFKGVSDTDFDLMRAPTRVEALVMLIRVLGKESAAMDGTYTHPFTDVPSWADPYVGYAYENSLTNGVSADKFGSTNATAATFLTFVLRALGYTDKDGLDFTWDDPFTLAYEVGILTEGVDIDNFLRADVAAVSYNALFAKMKESGDTLSDKLIFDGVFTVEQFGAAANSVLENNTNLQSSSDGRKLTAVEISEKCAPAVFFIEVYSYSGKPAGTGSGFFVSEDGYAITSFHIVANSDYMIITTTDGKKYDNVKIVDTSEKDDLALIRVVSEDSFTYLEAGDSTVVKQGQIIYAIGSPLGLENTLSQGIVSNVKRVIDETQYIQISVPVDNGSSGGAIIDEYGKVIGVTSAGYLDNNADLNLAIPAEFFSALDKNAKDVKTWASNSYLGFDDVYDFGEFAGMTTFDYSWRPLEITAEYSITSVNPIDPIDPTLPNLTASAVFSECVERYTRALTKDGFVRNVNEDGWMVYTKGGYKVKLLDITSGERRLKIAVTRQAEYYRSTYYNFSKNVPDAGWYMGFTRVVPVVKGTELTYTYNLSELYENVKDMAVDLTLYLLLLADLGFEMDTYNSKVSDTVIQYRYIGNQYAVDIIITEKEFTVKILPVVMLPASESFAKLRKYLFSSGEYKFSSNTYRLREIIGDDQYDVTYYDNDGYICIGLFTKLVGVETDGYIKMLPDGRTTVNYKYTVDPGDGSEPVIVEYTADLTPGELSSETKFVNGYCTDPKMMETYHDLTLERTLAAIRFCDTALLPKAGITAAELGFENIYN